MAPGESLLRHQRLMLDGVGTLYHKLYHKPAHLACVSFLGGIVVCQGYVGGPLKKPVKVVGIYGHLVVYCGQSVSLTYRVGDKRGIVRAFGHIAL